MSEDITQTQIEILDWIKSQGQGFSSTRTMGERFGLSIRQINLTLRELLRWGYRFETNRRGEIRFKSAPDILFAHEITRGLQTKILGKEIRCYRSVGSSNSVAQRLALRDAPEGTIVIAGRQTAGRGRLGRNWVSPAKVGIYMSAILRPEITPAQAPGLSLVAALAVAEAIRDYPGLPAQIKWPNDVVIGGKKAAGVLTELSAEMDRTNFVIIGIGVNANHMPKDFPEDLAEKATSLRSEQGSSVDRVRLVQAIVAHLEHRYSQFLKSGLKEQLKPIKAISCLLSRRITFLIDQKAVSGIATDIDEDGSLVVSIGKRMIRLSSGEVSLAESYAQ
jgi:BirA family transcriptional regulator, biotin operon repressor / biotin---[acetyl-CoA-carboxylase] ligase